MDKSRIHRGAEKLIKNPFTYKRRLCETMIFFREIFQSSKTVYSQNKNPL